MAATNDHLSITHFTVDGFQRSRCQTLTITMAVKWEISGNSQIPRWPPFSKWLSLNRNRLKKKKILFRSIWWILVPNSVCFTIHNQEDIINHLYIQDGGHHSKWPLSISLFWPFEGIEREETVCTFPNVVNEIVRFCIATSRIPKTSNLYVVRY